MNQLYDMHCHMGFAPAPAIATAQEGAAAGIGAFSCTVAADGVRAAATHPGRLRRMWPSGWARTRGGSPTGAWARRSWPGSASWRARRASSGRSGSTSRGRAIRKRAAPGRRAPSPAFWPHATSPQRPWRPPIPKARQQPAGKTEPVSQPRAPRRTHPGRHPPQRHRHCAEAHLHPRRQCRRRGARCCSKQAGTLALPPA